MGTITVNGVEVPEGGSVSYGGTTVSVGGTEPDWAKEIEIGKEKPISSSDISTVKNDDSIANTLLDNPNDPITSTLGEVTRSVSDATNSLSDMGSNKNMGNEIETTAQDETDYHSKIDQRFKTMYTTWIDKLKSQVDFLDQNKSKWDNSRTVTASFNGPPENVRSAISNVMASAKGVNLKEAATVMLVPGDKSGINQGSSNDFNVSQSNTGASLKKTVSNVKNTIKDLQQAIATTKTSKHSLLSKELKSITSMQINNVANSTSAGTSELGSRPIPGIQNSIAKGLGGLTDVFNLGMGQNIVDGLIKKGVQQLGTGLSNAFGSFLPMNKFEGESPLVSNSGVARAARDINKPGSKLFTQLNEKLQSEVLNNLSSPAFRSASNKINTMAKSRMSNILTGVTNASECAPLTSHMGTEYGIVPKNTVMFTTNPEDDTDLISKLNTAIEQSKENFKDKTFTMKMFYGV